MRIICVIGDIGKKPITSLAKIGDKILLRENKSTSGIGDEILDNLAKKLQMKYYHSAEINMYLIKEDMNFL